MKGVVIKDINTIHEDERRKIDRILNGEMGIRDVHVLYMKQKAILGNHWHTFPEAMWVVKGKVHYWMKHMITGELEEMDIHEGQIMFKTGFIVHTGECSEDCVLVDFSSESWISPDFNNHVEILK